MAEELLGNRRFLIAEGTEIRAGVVCREWDEKQRQLVEAGRISQVSSEIKRLETIEVNV